RQVAGSSVSRGTWRNRQAALRLLLRYTLGLLFFGWVMPCHLTGEPLPALVLPGPPLGIDPTLALADEPTVEPITAATATPTMEPEPTAVIHGESPTTEQTPAGVGDAIIEPLMTPAKPTVSFVEPTLPPLEPSATPNPNNGPTEPTMT